MSKRKERDDDYYQHNKRRYEDVDDYHRRDRHYDDHNRYNDDHRRDRNREYNDNYRNHQRRSDNRRNYDGRANYGTRAPNAPQKFFDEDTIKKDSEIPPHRNGIQIWNFSDEVPYNIIVSEGSNDIKKTPIPPEIEYRRAQEIVALRSEYEQDCVTILHGMGAPKESFNRWLFEQLAIPKASISTPLDPLLCNPEIVSNSDVIKTEILAEIPSRIRYRYPKQARTSLTSYLREGRSWLAKLKSNEAAHKDDFEKASKYLLDAQQWLNKQPSYADESQLESYKEQLNILKNECSPLFHILVQDNINQICERLAKKAREVIDKMAKLNEQEVKSSKIIVTSADQIVTVTYGDKLDHFNMNVSHYNKLRCLYRKHNECPEDSWESSFHDRLYVLLRRYQTFFGPSDLEGGNFHAALPESGFDLLRRKMEVSQECFASPFNCYFSRFCSAFPDTDVFFGSRGSFFDFDPIEGSFECGPPYTIEVMDRTAEHCIALLKKTEKPLSFIVFVPEWTDTKYGKLMHPDNCEYCVDHFLADKENHKYVTGLQHLAVNTVEKTNQRYWTLPFPTHVYFLQNKAAKEKWPAVDVVAKLKEVMEKH